MFLVAAIASGCAWFLATAKFDVWPLAWVAALPLFYCIERAPTTKRAVLYAWLAGTVMNAGGFYWLAFMLERFVPLPLPLAIVGLFAISAAQGLGFALFAWILRSIRAHTRLPLALLAPVVMVPCELWAPALFRYYLALTQAWQPAIIQIAEVTGVVGVTALLFAVNGAVWDLAVDRRRRPALITAGVLAVCLGYGVLRIGQVDAQTAAAPRLTVGLIQGNVDFDEKGVENPNLAPEQVEDLHDLSDRAEQAGAELVVWSETSFPYIMDRGITQEPLGAPFRGLEPSADGKGTPRITVPMVIGAVTFDPEPGGRFNPDKPPYNTALYLDRDGKITGVFDKKELVLGSERLPLVDTFPALKKILPRSAGRFTPGERAVTFDYATKDGTRYRLAPLICFEDIIPSFGREVGALHPHLLVNLTNDVWFGDTSGPWEHLALAVFRSVELRTAMVRAVNTGVSAYVDPVGRVVAHIPVRDPAADGVAGEVLIARPPLLEGGHTLYARFGDLFGYACTAATLFLWAVWPRVRRKR